MFGADKTRLSMNITVALRTIPIVAVCLCIYAYTLPVGLFFSVSPINTWVVARIVAGFAFNLLFFVVLTTILEILGSFIIRKLAWLLLSLYLTIYTFVYVYHFLLYGQLPGVPSVFALIDTNRREAIDFASSVFELKYFIYATIAAAPLLLIARYPHPRNSSGLIPNRFAVPSLCLLLAGFCWAGLRHASLGGDNPFLSPYASIAQAFEQKDALKAIYSRISENPPKVSVDPARSHAVHVLVIGEALTRNHMSLYGYWRDTTPNLARMKGELFLATDSCSARGTTILAIQELLTFANRDDSGPLFNGPNIIQVLKAANFRTYWISNQQNVGVFDSWAGVFARSADTSVFVNKRGIEEISYDEKVLEPFEEALRSQVGAKFIIVHLMGSHDYYPYRYPASFAKYQGIDKVPDSVRERFSPGGIFKGGLFKNLSFLAYNKIAQYNYYDNTVYYNDFIVYKLLELFKRYQGSTFTYLPDHGESLGETSDFIGHIDGPAPRQVYQIPLIFYLSQQFQEKLGGRIATFRANLSKPFQSDSIIHTLLDLYGISYTMFQANRSLLSPEYQVHQRFCDTLAP
ncbi:MAG: phosphoethanolamine transferase [Methylocella sp.]